MVFSLYATVLDVLDVPDVHATVYINSHQSQVTFGYLYVVLLSGFASGFYHIQRYF